jgi:hypothetical protein
MSFLDGVTVPDAGSYWIRRARVPRCFLAAPVAAAVPDGDGAVLLDLLVDGQNIVRIEPAGANVPADAPALDLAGRQPSGADRCGRSGAARALRRADPQ